MSAAAHGEYRAGLGWYDHGRRAWVDHPTKVSRIEQRSTPRPNTLADAQRDIPEHRSREQRVTAADLAAWRPSPEMESLRRLRDSHLPEERAQAQRLLSGPRRVALSNYEDGLRAMQAAGVDLPDDVAPLS